MSNITAAIDQNRPWIGHDYQACRIFVLGESYTGSWEGEMEYDDTYMAALLSGTPVVGSELFIKMAEKLGTTPHDFWHRVAFTNMSLGSIGATNSTKVTQSQLNAGRPRLKALLQRLEPKGVLILGVKTQKAAAPVCDELSIAHRKVYHPSGINNANPKTACTPKMLRNAWDELCQGAGISHCKVWDPQKEVKR
jgi:hypothetical protein